MSDEGSRLADVSSELIDSVIAIRGLVATARSQLALADEPGGSAELLDAADLQIVRLTVDLERIGRGQNRLDLTIRPQPASRS